MHHYHAADFYIHTDGMTAPSPKPHLEYLQKNRQWERSNEVSSYASIRRGRSTVANI